jgi:hypothetical protein
MTPVEFLASLYTTLFACLGPLPAPGVGIDQVLGAKSDYQLRQSE